MPPWRKVRVRGSKMGASAESWVTVSVPVSALRATRNVPWAQPSTRYGSPGRSHKNRYTSSPGRNTGTPSTCEWRWPEVPPMVRTVTMPESRPLLRSRTSKRVSVQSSPRSQRNSEPRQRSRATAVDCCARSSKRKRANVVALAKAAVRLRSSMPTKKHIQRNLLRWVKLISLHLQRAGGGGFVQICVLNEERARAGSRGGGYLQRKVNDAEASGLLGDDRDVAGPGDGVGHAGIQTAGQKQANVRGDNSGGGPLQRHRISGERARI